MMESGSPLFLCIDTSERSCSVALTRGIEVLGHRRIDEDYKHSEMLGPFVSDIMDDAELRIEDLDALIVASGPGSYTGLRVGFALIKALSFVSSTPVIGVGTLEATAHILKSKTSADCYLPMIDARRMEVYAAYYNRSLKELIPPHPLVLTADFFALERFQNQSFATGGSGSFKLENFVLPGNVEVIDIQFDAKHLAAPGLLRYKLEKWEDPAYFEPLYLKEARITQAKQTLLF